MADPEGMARSSKAPETRKTLLGDSLLMLLPSLSMGVILLSKPLDETNQRFQFLNMLLEPKKVLGSTMSVTLQNASL